MSELIGRLPPRLLGVALALACGALVACGGTTIPYPPLHACGIVHEQAGHVPPGDAAAATAAENCFAQDYAKCQPATLVYIFMGVDTGTTRTFSEHLSNGTCTVTDAVQGYTANGGGKTFPTQSYTCAGLRQQADGLHVTGCGQDGDVVVPAPTAA